VFFAYFVNTEVFELIIISMTIRILGNVAETGDIVSLKINCYTSFISYTITFSHKLIYYSTNYR